MIFSCGLDIKLLNKLDVSSAYRSVDNQMIYVANTIKKLMMISNAENEELTIANN
jgi:hypothetical protein